jgi:uncharacterized protein YndB with AHSA1/START domain
MSDSYEVKISRYFDAPVDMVYRCFVDPQQLAQWFGPLQFVVPTDSVDIDARPGGRWRMTMVNKDDASQSSPVNSTFEEVIENELLVGYEIATGFPGVEDGTKITARFEFTAEGDGTRLNITQGPFPEFMQEMSATGWGQSLFKLDALLQTPAKFRTKPEGADDALLAG